MEQEKQSINKDNFIKQDYPEEPKNNNNLLKWIILSIIVLIILIGGYFIYQYYFNNENTEEPIVCTEEAKVCLDGTTVFRVLPDCEFAECPEVEDPTADWKILNGSFNYKISYPSYLEFKNILGTQGLSGDDFEKEILKDIVTIDELKSPYYIETPFGNIPDLTTSISLSLKGHYILKENEENIINAIYEGLIKERFEAVENAEKININGNPAIRYNLKGDYCTVITKIPRPNTRYIYSLSSHDYSALCYDSDNYKKIIKMHNSFEFSDETDNWNNYQNEEYGYEIKYPSDLTVEFPYGLSDVRFLKDSKPVYSVIISELSGSINNDGKIVLLESLDLKDFLIINLKQRCKSLNIERISWDNFKIGEDEWIQGSYVNIYDDSDNSNKCGNQYLPWTLLKKNGFLYSIKFNNTKPFKGSVFEYNQILSTFKFID